MKKLLFLLTLLFPVLALCQPSSQSFTATLTAACTNATTTCDGTANSQLKFGIGEYAVASVTVKGTFTGATLFWEFSDDGGTSWFPTTCTRNDSSIQELSEAIPDSTNRSWDCGVGAARVYRVRLSAIGTGGPQVTATLSSIQIEPAPTVSLALPNTQFATQSNPAAGSQATITIAAGGPNIKNVATLVCFSASSVVAPALTSLNVNLRDGATGAGTIRATWQLAISATTGQNVVPFCVNLNYVGPVNTQMTLEFSASLANLSEAVTLHGYTTP